MFPIYQSIPIDIVVEPEEDEAQVEEQVADETLNLRRLLKHPDSGLWQQWLEY